MSNEAQETVILRVLLAGGRKVSVLVSGPEMTRATMEKLIAFLELSKDSFTDEVEAETIAAEGQVSS